MDVRNRVDWIFLFYLVFKNIDNEIFYVLYFIKQMNHLNKTLVS